MQAAYRVLCVEFESNETRNSKKFKNALKEKGYDLVEFESSELKRVGGTDFCAAIQFGLSPVPNHKRGLYHLDYLEELFPGVPRMCVTGHDTMGAIMEIESRNTMYFSREGSVEQFVERVEALCVKHGPLKSSQ